MKVLIIDDSALVRSVVGELLRMDPSFTSVDAAADPLFAERRIASAPPDVILLDMEMPRMDGLTFLKKLMSTTPIPVVVFSSLTHERSGLGLDFLRAGAVAVLQKPRLGLKDYAEESGAHLIATIKAAADSHPKKIGPAPAETPAPPPPRSAAIVMRRATGSLIAIGASAGGTTALEQVLSSLPEDCAPIVVVQHMPEIFTAQFANRLNTVCRIAVKEAAEGDAIRPGQALIAPGNYHLLVRRTPEGYFAALSDGPRVKRHRPSVDVLFRSVAAAAGRQALGIILTGMGDDGADGLLEMKKAGAETIAQTQETCLVYGMPGSAVAKGAVDRQVALFNIADEVASFGKI